MKLTHALVVLCLLCPGMVGVTPLFATDPRASRSMPSAHHKQAAHVASGKHCTHVTHLAHGFVAVITHMRRRVILAHVAQPRLVQWSLVILRATHGRNAMCRRGPGETRAVRRAHRNSRTHRTGRLASYAGRRHKAPPAKQACDSHPVLHTQACRTDRRAPRYQTRSNERARSVNPPPPPKTSRARARWFCPQALASVMPSAHSLSGPSAAHCLLWDASLCSEKNRVRDRVSLAADSRCPRASCNRPPQCRRTPRRPAAVRALCSGGRQTWPL